MVIEAFKQAFSVLKKRPLLLWGLSLMTTVICGLAIGVTTPLLIIVGVGFAMIISTGMQKVYVDALQGKEVNSDQLFEGLKRKWTVLGALAWRVLWFCIWVVGSFAIPALLGGVVAAIGVGFLGRAQIVATIFFVLGGIIFSVLGIGATCLTINRFFAYAFVPYIVITDPEVTFTEALRRSIVMTKGKKMSMFLSDLLFFAVIGIVSVVLLGLSLIPYVGGIFAAVYAVVMALVGLFAPLFRGLYQAWFFVAPTPEGADKPDFIDTWRAKLSGYAAAPAPAQTEEAPAEESKPEA